MHILKLLKRSEYIKPYDVWAFFNDTISLFTDIILEEKSHLVENVLMGHISICGSLLKWSKTPFLKRMIACDKKWIVCHNLELKCYEKNKVLHYQPFQKLVCIRKKSDAVHLWDWKGISKLLYTLEIQNKKNILVN